MHVLLQLLVALTLLLPRSACSETLTFKSAVVPTELTATLRGTLSFPSGSGPFPVVILLHPCGGLEPFALATLRTHSKTLISAGFGTLIPDSYGPRNLDGGKACDMAIAIKASLRRDDAFAAMVALHGHSKVSKDNIFVFGQSDGGVAALLAAKGGAGSRFSAVAAYYPPCGPLSGRDYIIQSPTLVFVAGKDDWTPPVDCISAKTRGIVTGAEFDVVTYPDAHHGFDQERKTVRYKGHTLGYSAAATADSRKRMIEFFVRHLTNEFKTQAPFSSSRK